MPFFFICIAVFDAMASCPQARGRAALGIRSARCRWQMKGGADGERPAQADAGIYALAWGVSRDPAAKPRMPQVRILSLGPSPYGIIDTMVP